MARTAAAAVAVSGCLLASVLVAAEDAVELKPNFKTERNISSGEVHQYWASLAAGTLLRVVVDQRGVDVVLKLYAPDGTKLREFDGPTGDQGPEPLSWLVEAAGKYRVDVAPLLAAGAAGRYEIRAADIRPATSAELAAAAIEKALAGFERQWEDAIRTRDMRALDRLMAEDFATLASAGGMNVSRAQTLKGFEEMAARFKDVTEAHDITDLSFKLLGDVAIATGHATITSRSSGRESAGGGRFVHIWQKEAGDWRIVADHWDSEGPVLPSVKPVVVAASALDALTGSYDMGSGALPLWTVARNGDGLDVKNERGWAERFLPASSSEFFARNDDATRLLFVRNDEGRVVELVILVAGHATRARRLDTAR